MTGSFLPLNRRASSLLNGNLDVEKRRVLLASEYVGLPGAPARMDPLDCKLDGIGRIKFDEVADPPFRNTEQFCDAPLRQHSALLEELVVLFLTKDDVKGNLIRTGVFVFMRFPPCSAHRRFEHAEKLHRIIHGDHVVHCPFVGGWRGKHPVYGEGGRACRPLYFRQTGIEDLP
jgi:hypothetical protein